MSPDAEALLLAYDYPGNIRELQNILQRAVLLAEGPVIEPRHLPEPLRELRPLLPREDEPEPSGFRDAKQRVVERFERDYVARCLTEARATSPRPPKAAGIDYKNFYTKMQQYGIDASGLQIKPQGPRGGRRLLLRRPVLHIGVQPVGAFPEQMESRLPRPVAMALERQHHEADVAPLPLRAL